MWAFRKFLSLTILIDFKMKKKNPSSKYCGVLQLKSDFGAKRVSQTEYNTKLPISTFFLLSEGCGEKHCHARIRIKNTGKN